ncbi:uncharacterized protein TNCV_3315211 [Trichonephila clavipes]|nr:uncharacterized protein TNCV_3315211 [Trichonephila clavipes]
MSHLEKDLVILSLEQVMRTASELAYPLLSTPPRQREDLDPRQILSASSPLHGGSSVATELETSRPTRGLLATDHVILNHGQVTWTTPELAPPLLTTTPHQREDVSALDRFNVHRCPTRRVFSGTGLAAPCQTNHLEQRSPKQRLFWTPSVPFDFSELLGQEQQQQYNESIEKHSQVRRTTPLYYKLIDDFEPRLIYPAVAPLRVRL